MISSTLTSKGQTTIPKGVREMLGLKLQTKSFMNAASGRLGYGH